VLDSGPAVLSMALTADGSLILGAANGTLHRIDDHGHVIRYGHSGFIWSVTSVGMRMVATAGEDGHVTLWDLDSLREISRLEIKASARSICKSKNHLVIGDGEGHIHCARIEGTTLRADPSPAKAHEGPVTCLMATDDGYISTGEDGQAILHRASIRILHRHSDFASCACRIGKYAVTGGYDGHILSTTMS